MNDLSTSPEAMIRLREFLAQGPMELSFESDSVSLLDAIMSLEQALPSDGKLISRAIANAFDIEFVESFENPIYSHQFVEKVPIGLARRTGVLAIKEGGDGDVAKLKLLVCNSAGLKQVENMRRCLRASVIICCADPADIQNHINLAYEMRNTQTNSILSEIGQGNDPGLAGFSLSEDLLETEGLAPIIKLVNSALFDAVKQRASDVHFQPYEDKLAIRFRIDGVLFDVYEVPKKSQEEVLSRVKVIGKMNIAEKRLPQDGRASVQIGDKKIDLRIASLPTSFGERIVVRLLVKTSKLFSLAEIGMGNDVLSRYQNLIRREHGMILVTGPTGGGKSTTLYASLQEINTKDRNVVTLEDPIEYQLSGISQTQVSEKKGLTFAKGLRNVLRQDPDIIMVGEIRDEETAEMAIQSALTGHLVFSTLHTNDAASSITRLLDLGIEPYLVASSVIGVLAQRLVRQICSECAASVPIESQLPDRLGSDWYSKGDTVTVGAGCAACRQTGYNGREGVYELMLVNDVVQRLVQQCKTSAEIRDYSRLENGMKLLKEDGIEKIKRGRTTIDEIFRISSVD